jgi:hypothetical protein
MGTEVVRVATRAYSQTWSEGEVRPAGRLRIRADHWILAFWVVVGAFGFFHFADARPHAMTAIDGGVVPPSTR